MSNASLLLLSLLFVGCAQTQPRHYWFADGKITSATIEQTLREHPLAAGQNISLLNLGVADSVSHHLVQVRLAEPLHIHRTHDLTVWIYRGAGRMTIGTNLFSVAAGDVVFVPRATPHRFENAGQTPAVAIVVFSPSLTGKDFELVESE
ncbi:MAG: cupin domain-containing protein [Verrucomicrobiota bacterium]